MDHDLELRRVSDLLALLAFESSLLSFLSVIFLPIIKGGGSGLAGPSPRSTIVRQVAHQARAYTPVSVAT